jgi:2-polyprenyl-3-methyl-5-hydroxy-6-metoxy-1,4-benzoquinol methylase
MRWPLFFPDTRRRETEPELMDLPDVDTGRLLRTVRQFKIINRLITGSRKLIRRHILPVIAADPERSWTFLDLGAGGCDIPIWLVKIARRKGYRLRVTCLDSDERIVPYARTVCRDYPEISIIQASAFDSEAWQTHDFIFANHFLHHIPDDDLPGLLSIISRGTGSIFLLNDIHRGRMAYILYTLLTAIFFHRSFAFYDGRLSILKAFKREELEEIVARANSVTSVSVQSCSPFRLYLLGKA